jgi:hypothetical protein
VLQARGLASVVMDEVMMRNAALSSVIKRVEGARHAGPE